MAKKKPTAEAPAEAPAETAEVIAPARSRVHVRNEAGNVIANVPLEGSHVMQDLKANLPAAATVVLTCPGCGGVITAPAQAKAVVCQQCSRKIALTGSQEATK